MSKELEILRIGLKALVLFLVSLILVGLFSCEDEPIEPAEPQCSCYEVYEKLEPVNVNGMPTLQWVIDYETAPIPMNCSSETEYYNTSNTERWRTVCQ